MHGTNFKDLVMGMTFIYFAYFLTINSYKELKNNSPPNVLDDPFRQLKNEEHNNQSAENANLLEDHHDFTQNSNTEN